MGVHVPHDVIFNHILPRVPAESVCRFNCVSKEWHSFLTSDSFKKKHNRHMDDHKKNPKLLVLSKTKTSFKLTTIDCEAPPSDKGLTPSCRPLPQFEDTNPHKIHILTSFHGLVCLGIIKDMDDDDGYSDLILWNPLTNEYKRLSKSNSHKECNDIRCFGSDFRLYYSCCEDDYKLLFVNYDDDNVYIYSLKSDSWRKVDVSQHTSILYHGRWSGGTYLNENLYFLQHDLNERLSSIVRFDTKTERLSKIETPSVFDYGNTYDYSATILVKSDCIHVCVKYWYDIKRGGFKMNCIKLWKLDEYENMKEVLTYQLRMHGYDYTIISYLIPFHLMKNGNWLMRNRFSYKIYEVDLKKKKHIKDKGREDGNIMYDDFEYAEVRVDDKNNYIVAVEGSYIETFVSPNRYMK